MDGLLVINKEKNYTSRDVVNVLSKKFNTKKIGHTGTLDPIATGVMVIAFGKALKLVEYITSDIKEYIATVKIGIITDTLDVTGNILGENKNYNIRKRDIEEVLKNFLGESLQEVPLYSAVKVNGKRLYDYARNNIDIELPKRKINIYDIELLNYQNDEFTFRVVVSKGTYIRSLIRDIGKKINVFCCMKELKRIRQGNFFIDKSYTLSDIQNNNYELISATDALSDFEKIIVDDYLASKVLNGRILDNRYNSGKIAFIDKHNNLLAIYKPYDKDITKIKPIKVLK